MYKRDRLLTMNRKRQTGFSRLKIIATPVIAATLLTMGTTSCAEYVQRARVSAGIQLAAVAKQAVSEYFSQISAFPDSNKQAGPGVPGKFSDAFVRTVSIEGTPTSGTETIVYNRHVSVANGDSVLLAPIDYRGTVLWRCSSNTIARKLLLSYKSSANQPEITLE